MVELAMSDRSEAGRGVDSSGLGDGGLGGGDASLSVREMTEAVFSSLPVAVVVFDRRLRMVMGNRAAELLFGDADLIAEALGRTTVEGHYRDWAVEFRQVMETRREREFDGVTYQDREVGDRLLNLVCTPLTDRSNREVVGGMLVAEDVTARVSMERRLAVSERLAAVGKLSARVAHELNNPLDGILRYINLAKRVVEHTGQDQVIGYLERSRRGLMRMVEITAELLEFSRSTHASLDESDINRILEDAVKAMENKAVADGVTIACNYHEQVPRLRGTSNIFQVFCNLIKNAIDAMPDGGVLSIATGVVEHAVVITFEDTGVGLPEEIERVFEPFFSTKGPGKGTGLGLAICRDIIEKYKGRITAARRAGGGSVFLVRIPLESCLPDRSDRFGGAGGKGT